MSRFSVVLFLLFVAAEASAQKVVVTSVEPSSGPVSGGTTVIIHGSGFAICAATPIQCGTRVKFGELNAAAFTVRSETTIEAVAPPSFPGRVNVGVSFPYDAGGLLNAFTYTGNVEEAFEPVLLPLYRRGTSPGAFGSIFVTDLSLWTTALVGLPVFGIGYPCDPKTSDCIPLSPPPPPLSITELRRDQIPATAFTTSGEPGLLLWVPNGGYDSLAASLRVRDLSRQDQSWGTAIPLVPRSEFRADFLALLDVPMNAGFRDTLRVYSLDRDASVHVTAIRFDGSISKEFDLHLANGADMFHPAYAQFGDFAVENYWMRIEIRPNAGKRIWAFVSITHNETQHVTIVTPH